MRNDEQCSWKDKAHRKTHTLHHGGWSENI